MGLSVVRSQLAQAGSDSSAVRMDCHAANGASSQASRMLTSLMAAIGSQDRMRIRVQPSAAAPAASH